MQEFRLKRMSFKDLIFKGEIIANTDNSHETGTHSTWLELTLYKTEVGKYILNTQLHVFNPPKPPQEYYGCVSFASAWDVYEYLRNEGKLLDEVVDDLIAHAALVDDSFVEACEHAKAYRGLLVSVTQSASASAA